MGLIYNGASKIIRKIVERVQEFTGATLLQDGSYGIVPAPKAGDNSKYLRGDGTWAEVQGGGGGSNIAVDTILDDGVNIADITVDQTVYHLFAPEGGGGGGSISISEETLWTNSSGSGIGTYTLSESINNYDFLTVYFGIYTEYASGIQISDYRMISVNDAKSLHSAGKRLILTGYANRVAYVDFNDTTMVISVVDGSQTVLQVNGIKLGSTSSSGGMSVVALDTEKRTTWNTSYELTDSLNNYELVLIQMYYTGDNYQYTGSKILKTSDLLGNDHGKRVWIDGGNNDRALYLYFTDDTHYQIVGGNSSNGIHGIYGIK